MNYKKYSLIFTIFILGIILGMVSMYTPKPKERNVSEFSALRASDDLKVIAKEPHDILNQDALADVRNYLLDELDDLGLTTDVHTYNYTDDEYGDVVIRNILTSIEGESYSYILVVSHYDSSRGHRSGETPGSHGAADAGYGVATMLEIARIIKENNQPLKNGIKFLFTDGEEIGLVGAELEVANNASYFDDVGFVINLEARGIKGPAIMFETSKNNQKVIDFYRKAHLPIAYSFAGDVYDKMPNGTDFTHFKKYGLNGINFAVLDSLDYYHTPKDNFENISLTSIQHYGEQVLPLVNEYIYNDQYSDVNYFKSTQSAIYFSLLPNIFLDYSVTTGFVLMFLILFLVGLSIYYFYRKDIINIKKVMKWTVVLFIPLFIFLILGVVISYLLSLLTGIKFSLTYMPNVSFALGVFISMLVFELIGFIWYTLRFKEDRHQLFFASILFNSLFLIIFMFILPGGSYIFLWPIMFSLITYYTGYLFRERINSYVKQMILGLNILVPFIIFIPLLYLFFLALTIGALGIVGFIAFLPLTIVASSFLLMVNE